MSMFKITGVVTFVSPIETFGENKESQRIIVETQDRYPNHFPISFYGGRMDSLRNVKVGDFVEVETYPGGRLKKGDPTVAFGYFNGNNLLVVNTGQGSQHTSAAAPIDPLANVARVDPASQRAKQMAASFDDVPF